MTPRLATRMIRLVPTPAITRALQLVEKTKDAAADARAAAELAERDHHEAILAALAVPDVTISAVARAAGVSRTRIYKRLASPVYGQRSEGEPTYGQRTAS